jgi:Family of unknown function (DUF6401)/Pentapeptide repeats (8 copies)
VFDDPAFDDSAHDKPAYDESASRDSAFHDAVFNDAALNDTAFNDAVFNDAVFSDTVFSDTVFSDSVFTGFEDFASQPAAFGDPIFGDYAPGTSPLAALADLFSRRLPELAFEPGLVAAVDQHSAAIRDAVYEHAYTRGEGHSSLREALTDYVLGFTDALREMGWHTHEGYDFATLRLTAVCHFMREYGVSAAD